MSCPPTVSVALLDILRIGILRTRKFAWDGRPDRCAIESDHIHNIPGLIKGFSIEAIEYYWNASRVTFLAQCADENLTEFELAWSAIEEFLGNGRND